MVKRALLNKVFGFKDEQLLAALEDIMIIRKFCKYEMIVLEGTVPHSIYINAEGIFRGFFFDMDGKEITDYFRSDPGAVLLSCESLGEKAHENLQAASDLTAIEFPLAEFIELLNKHVELALFQKESLLRAIEQNYTIKEVCCRLKAREKYLWFLETYPDLVNHVRAKDIASFLDMTPVSLSRVRKALKEE